MVVATQEDTAKKNSLKRNYGGGIATTRKRNQEAIDRLKDEHELRCDSNRNLEGFNQRT